MQKKLNVQKSISSAYLAKKQSKFSRRFAFGEANLDNLAVDLLNIKKLNSKSLRYNKIRGKFQKIELAVNSVGEYIGDLIRNFDKFPLSIYSAPLALLGNRNMSKKFLKKDIFESGKLIEKLKFISDKDDFYVNSIKKIFKSRLGDDFAKKTLSIADVELITTKIKNMKHDNLYDLWYLSKKLILRK